MSMEFHVAICVLYALSVFAMQQLVKSFGDNWKPPTWMNTVKLTHNIALSLVSGWMFVVMVKETYQAGRYESWDAMACSNAPANGGSYGFANWIYLVSKLWEWADTYFLVLYGKKVIALHYFHHMTTFTMAAVVHNFPVGGYCWINALVHFVMYAHYAKPVSWARPFITSFQLLQFVAVLSINLYGFSSQGCYDYSAVTKEWMYCQGVVFGYFLLFLKFYFDNYIAKKKKRPEKKD